MHLSHENVCTYSSYQLIFSKMHHVCHRITRYKAGYFSLAVAVVSLLVVLMFLVGLFFRWFWESLLFANPIYLLSIALFELVLGFSASYVEKRENTALLSDIEGLFDDWWEDPDAVRVTVRRVYGTYPQQADYSCRCFNNRQGKFISMSFQREDDSDSVGMTRTMDTQSVD